MVVKMHLVCGISCATSSCVLVVFNSCTIVVHKLRPPEVLNILFSVEKLRPPEVLFPCF